MIFNYLRNKLVIIIILLVFFAVLPLFAPTSITQVFGKIWVMALFAISLDLIFGYTGLVSLGHSAFLAVGAYTAALLLKNHIVDSFWIILVLAIISSAIVAAILGLVALRTKGTYFLLITLGFAGLIYSIVFKWTEVTGGGDGISALPQADFDFWVLPFTTFALYYFTFVIFIICCILIYLITKSAFGKALVGIKQNEIRMNVSGYNTWLYKYIAFIIAGIFAGIAGVSYAYYNSFVGPGCASITQSATALLMVILGGPGTLFGAVLGAGIVTLLEYYASILLATRWPIVIGVVFILVIMFLRGGIATYIIQLFSIRRKEYGSSENQ